jgi:hypothetical protein
MFALSKARNNKSAWIPFLQKCIFAVPFSALVFSANLSAQLLDPLQVFEQGVDCPVGQPGAPNNFVCTSNDIKLDLVQISGLASCVEGEIATATFNVDLEVNANIRYNPMVWISENGIDPAVTGAMCFVSSIPDGPISHIPELLFSDANSCADVDVPNNNFTLANLNLGEVEFLCVDTNADGLADIPIMVTWNNSGGQECAQGGPYPINQTPSKCSDFIATTDITVVQNPGIELIKAGVLNDDDGTPGVSAGDSIDYTFSVENTGNVVLTNVVLSDPGIVISGGPIASLGVGVTDTTTFTGTYIITQTDIDFGSFTNTATVNSAEGVSDTSTFIQPLQQDPALTLVKSGTLNDDDGTAGVSAGDSISYIFTVTNTGNMTLTGITVSDPVATVIGGPLATLAPGASDNTTFTGTYIITQGDIDAGTFTNTATANSNEGATDDDSDTQPLAQNSGLTLVKVATPQTYSAASQTIDYQFQFTNSGNVTLYPPYTVTDDVSTDESCPAVPASLAPGESVTCTASYIITQPDVDAGSVTNTASGTAQDPADQTVTSNDDSETVTAVGTGTLVLVKTATPQTYNAVGDVIAYSYVLTNGTNVTLSPPYIITDDKSIDENCPAVPASLASGESVTCTASYTITQADLDAGSVTNTASGTAQDPGDQTVTSNDDSETVTAVVGGSLTLVKTATPQTYSAVDDVIAYSYLLTNNMNVTLYAPYTITDDQSSDESCPATPASLAPGESVTCTASYTIIQADMDAGSVVNVASGTAQDAASGGQPVTSNQDTETVTVVAAGTLSLVKTATPQTYSAVDDVIAYSYLLTNNFNVTLYAPYTITDDQSSDESCPATPASLAPGESVTCTASYTITQADMDAGSVVNVASGTAQDAASGGQPVTSNQDTETVNVVITGALTLVKTATPQTYSAVGDVIAYSYLLTNGTNGTLYPPYTITDDQSSDESCPATPASLASGESVTCTASYTITQGDMDAGSVTNVASGTAQDAVSDGQTVTSNQDTETVNAVSINLAKSAATPSYNVITGRYTVVYTITATNSGSAAGTYDVTDTFTLATGINLFSAVIAYAGGETQTGTPAGPLPYSFTNGETVVTGEGLAGGASEQWTVIGVFDVDPTLINDDARACVAGDEQAGQGFYNRVTGVDNESDLSDNDACENLPDATIDLVKTAGDATYLGDSKYSVIYTITANNLGDGPGYYDLTDTIDPGNGITVSLAQLTSYNAGTENNQSGTLAGALPYSFTSPETLVTDEALAGGRNEFWTVEVEFTVAFDQIDDTLQCSDVNGGAGTGFYNRVEGSPSDPDDSNNHDCTSALGGVARFLVTKAFSDNNPADVQVAITCNDGLPLGEEFTISQSSHVNFVVTSFLPAEMNCEVKEIAGPDGYITSYEAGTITGIAEIINDDPYGCHYEGVIGGQFTCHITNNAKPTTFTVYKEWVINIEGGDVVDLMADVTISCESEIFEDDAVETDPGLWTLSGEIGDGGSLKATVDTTTGSARCSAIEKITQSGVESIDDCGWRDIPAGGSDDCTFTNTVFFEGIPTLSQYGLMVLALLMFGVGAVGFRRFV